MDLTHKKDFDQQVAALSEWLDKTEMNLELLTSEATDPQDQLTLEEQMVLVKVHKLLQKSGWEWRMTQDVGSTRNHPT